MSLIYITGIAGAGKSAVCDELVRRGYEAHEADNTLSNFVHNKTGRIFTRPTLSQDRTAEWRKHHTWTLSKEKLLELKQGTGDRLVFVCGVAGNEEDYIEVFDHIYALDVDDETLKHRVTTRTTGDFGKSRHEMKSLLEWQQTTASYYKKVGAHVVDSTQPLSKVVDDILNVLKAE